MNEVRATKRCNVCKKIIEDDLTMAVDVCTCKKTMNKISEEIKCKNNQCDHHVTKDCNLYNFEGMAGCYYRIDKPNPQDLEQDILKILLKTLGKTHKTVSKAIIKLLKSKGVI